MRGMSTLTAALLAALLAVALAATGGSGSSHREAPLTSLDPAADDTDLYAFTAEGDPNSAVIVGDDGCIVFDAQATPAIAGKVIERVRTVTDKPIKYVVLSHYHAVRVLGATGRTRVLRFDTATRRWSAR